jgi:hypothetical protein
MVSAGGVLFDEAAFPQTGGDMDTTPRNGGEASLESVVSRGKLRRLLDGKKITRAFRPTGFDRELLKVADAAVESYIPTAIVLPVPGTRTPVLLAASMLVSFFVRTGKLTSHIALVSKQVGLRQFYDALYIGKYDCLGEYFPRTVVDASGLALDSSELPLALLKKRGRLHFVPGVERLGRLRFKRSPSLIELDGMVLESQACDESELRKLLALKGGKIPIVYLTVDPYDPALNLFRESGAIWAWDAIHMASFASDEPDDEAICTGAEVLAGAAETAFEVTSPEGDTELDAALARLWDDLLEMRRNPAGPAFASLSWVWGLFATLSQLVVPLEDYDKCARLNWNTALLSDAPAKAAAFSRNAVGEEQELWQILADDLYGAIEAAREDDYKPARMAGWVDDAVSGRNRGVIVARNRAMVKAIEAYLQEHPGVPMGWSDVVDTIALSDLSSGRKAMGTGEALIPGPLPWRYGWMLALPTTDRVTVLAHGSWEASHAVRQIEGTAKRLEELARGEVRENATLKLFGHDARGEAKPRAAASRITHSARRATKAPVTVRDAVWSPFDLKVARSLKKADVDPPALPAPGEGTGSVEAILISFDNGAGFFEPNCLVSKLHEGTIKEVAAKSLRPGDRIVLIEREAKRDLFTIIVEKLEDLPDFTPTVTLIEEWHERARHAGLRCGLDNEQILARMNGTRITDPGTIGCWIKGIRHGPNDPEDIKRFGKAVGDEFLVKKWETIGRALTIIRGHRIKVGKMLGAAITGASSTDMEDNGYFDRRLGIHYSDLVEAVSAHVVREVSDTPAPVPQLRVNRLLEPGESLRMER